VVPGHVRKKQTDKKASLHTLPVCHANLASQSASAVSIAYSKAEPLPPGTYEEALPFDADCFPDAEVEDIMETYKIKFESIRPAGNPDGMATSMRHCILGTGLKNPHDHVFNDWLNDGNMEVNLVVTVSD